MKRNIFRLSVPLLFFLHFACTQQKDVIIMLPEMSSPRVRFGVQEIKAELTKHGYHINVYTNDSSKTNGLVIQIISIDDSLGNTVNINSISKRVDGLGEEGFALTGGNSWLTIAGKDDTGTLYGCLELVDRIKEEGKLPGNVSFIDAPKMELRGTCIGMQKTYVIPEYGGYNYPYTPELFPFFYDKARWLRYLDMLVENRYNTLYLWSGHPFSSLVKLKDYPYALDVDEETFKKNEEIFSFLTREADKRGIWVIQMFYNIHVGKNFAEHNRILTHAGKASPLLEDYTRKSIAAFVEKYPNVGLLTCLGEALGPVSEDIKWLNRVIIPGVKEGMKRLGTDKEPPIVIRGHSTDPPAAIKAALPYYKNLYTMLKYNGEALTTYAPRGPWAETHRELSRLGSTHIDNVHLLANLEPFRWVSPDFVQRSVSAIHKVHRANGLHLYPQASYWDWPYTADKTSPRLYQVDRDWMWYKAWGRYAWDDQRDSVKEREYWSGVLEGFYGCPGHGGLILDALQESGECAPKGLRRFGVTDGNRQCYALGMFMLQLIDREKYSPWIELWRSDSPEGEGLEEYVEKEMKGLPHTGETPPQIAGEIRAHGEKAVKAIEEAAFYVTENKEEFERLKNDIHCISLLSDSYADKSRSAIHLLRYKYNRDIEELDTALIWLGESVRDFEHIAERTENTYLYANSLQVGFRQIPNSGEGGKNKHWSELLPLYKQELETFKVNMGKLKEEANFDYSDSTVFKMQPVPFELLSDNMEKYTLAKGEPVFRGSKIVLNELAPGLAGLTGIRFSESEAASEGVRFRFKVNEPVQLLVGYFNSTGPGFLEKPNLETNAFANERGGLGPIIRDAATFVTDSGSDYPEIDVHAYKYGAGTHEMDFGKGRFLILGIIGGIQNLKTRGSNQSQKIIKGDVNWLFE